MSRKISIIIFYFITIQISVLGQNIDSLEQQLTKVQNIDKIDLLNQLSEEYCNEGYYQKAHDYADEALEIAQKYNNKTETANAYCQLGKSYNFLQIYDSSLIYFDLALELFENLDDQEGKANTLRNIGRLYENKYDYNKSLEYYIESLKMFEELNLLNELGGVYQDIGYVYICSEKYDLALKYYEKALAIYDELQDKYSISVTYNNIGIAYDAMKDVEKALEYYNKSIVLNKELGNEIVAAYIMHNIGIIYNNEGELDTAYKYFKESLKITELYEDPYGVCYNLARIAVILKKQNKLDSALIILDKSLEYSILIDDKKSISENYLEYSNIFELKKDYFKAFEFYKMYDQLQDTIFNDDMIKQMNELETKYQSEKKDAENLLLKEQSRKREIFTYFLAVIILLVLFLAVVFFRGKRKQQKVNQLLEIKNNEINQQKEEIQAQAEELEKVNVELEKLSIVASETDNAVVIMDKNGNFEWVNEGFTRLYGYNLEETKERIGDSIQKSSSNSNIEQLLQFCINKKQSIIYESQTSAKKGNVIWAQTTITPITDHEGNVVKLIAIDSDISKLKKAEAEILQKNEEILAQKDALEEQNEEILQKNEEISAQRNELERINEHIEIQNEQIRGSIRYAKTIQNAILPSISEIEKKYSTFVIYRPKDIVSGDFYWYLSIEQYDFIVVADCTGHGVPGAFMSMIGSRLINEAIAEAKIFDTKQIMETVDILLKKALKKEVSEIHDGMELIICRIEKINEDYNVNFTGAKRPLFVSKNNELITFKGDRRAIGGSERVKSPIKYSTQQILLKKDDIIYMFSDGYVDQNNSSRVRYGTSKLINNIDYIKGEELTVQQEFLINQLDIWQGIEEQRDDITLFALKFK